MNFRLSSPTRTLGALGAVIALVATPYAAFAQGGVSATQAESLFNQAKDLINQKKYHEACDRFQASYKLDKNNNTMLALAACHDLEGKTATAWGEYLQVVNESRGTPAADYAQSKAHELAPQLLTIKLAANVIPPDITIKVDGASIPKETLNAELPLDPGEHDIEAKAAGKHDWMKHIKLRAEDSPLKIVLSMEDMTPEELKAQQQKDHPPPGSGNAEDITPADPVKRWVGVSLIGVGVIGIGVGVAFLVSALGLRDKFNNEGQGKPTCDLPLNTVAKNAFTGSGACHTVDSNGNTFAQVANTQLVVMGVVGGIGVVAATVGTILLLTSFESKRIIKRDIQFTPQFAPGYAGFGMSGTF
ncbi:hypothetical protein BH09MYX1_BH09MYX1_30630 [soil metagenome]